MVSYSAMVWFHYFINVLWKTDAIQYTYHYYQAWHDCLRLFTKVQDNY
jgi:hypothetical protein